MRKSRIPLLLVLISMSVALTACTGAIPDRSWPESLVVDNTIYTASQSYIFAVDGETGKELDPKRFPKDAEGATAFGSTPSLIDDQLYIGDYASQLRIVAKNLSSQSAIVKDATGRFLSSPVAFGDLILAANADHNLYAFDKSLKLKWKFTAKNSIWTKPVIFDDLIFVSSTDKSVYALKQNASKDGVDVVWSKDLGGSVFFSQTIDENGILYIGTLNNELFAIDAKSGNINWQVKTAGTVWAPVVVLGDRLFAGDQSGKIFALNIKDGSQVWEYDAGSPVIGGVAVRETSLFAGTQKGQAICISKEDNPANRMLWTKEVGGKLYSTPVFTQSYVVFGGMEGDNTLTAIKFNGDSGWTFKPSK
ncbi:MAG: PQQ-binding-like beta-propeller repeat protein [Leptolinea sp.]|jgi:outer membrane protein assembly factor BamB|nr:PQQ-binding-like beta-propeller repeat protein [Leptolinea sp.]